MASDRSTGRSWTAYEDHLLKQAVATHGENDNWKTIALSVPGRTNKACRKRWLHSLSPTIKKSAWTPDEDDTLLRLYELYPNKWSMIARQIPGRTDDACSKRYREALDPRLKKDEWTAEEDERLMAVYSKIGGRWGQVGQEMNRSGLGCRNRWRLLQRKRAAEPPVFTQDESPVSQYASFDDYESTSTPEIFPSSPWTPLSVLDAPPPFWDGQVSPFTDSSPGVPSVHLPLTQEDLLMSQMDLVYPQDDMSLLTVRSETPPPFHYSSSSLSAALLEPLTLRSPTRDSTDWGKAFEQRDNTHDMQSTSTTEILTSPASSAASETLEDIPMPAEETDTSMTPHISDISEVTGRSTPKLSSDDLNDHSQDSLLGEDQTYSDARRHSAPNSSVYAISDTLSHNIPSTSSTPITFASMTLSPASSPNINTPTELPSVAQAVTASVLFTPYYKTVTPPKPAQKKAELHSPLRLSANLAATSDPSVLPYACGHEQCWPPDASTSTACYATSKELTEHSRTAHDGQPGGERPFRCALEGCGKSWKSVNGLQYHLQISKSHFQRAISSTLSSVSITNLASADSPASQSDSEPVRKFWPCTQSNCFKQYRQLSGLRYHLAHGHPDDLPAQLEVVPPALARKVAERIRRKPSSVK